MKTNTFSETLSDSATEKEIAERHAMNRQAEAVAHVNALLDELRWFRQNRIHLNIAPTPDGWSITVKLGEPDK